MDIWGKLKHEMAQGCPESAGVQWWLLRSKCPFPALDMFSFLSSHTYLFSEPQTHYNPFLHCPVWFPILPAPTLPQDHFKPFTAWARQSLTKLSAKCINLHVKGSAVCSEFGKMKSLGHSLKTVRNTSQWSDGVSTLSKETQSDGAPHQQSCPPLIRLAPLQCTGYEACLQMNL